MLPCIRYYSYSSTTRVNTPYSSRSRSVLCYSYSSRSSQEGTTPTRVGSSPKKGECISLALSNDINNNLLEIFVNVQINCFCFFLCVMINVLRFTDFSVDLRKITIKNRIFLIYLRFQMIFLQVKSFEIDFFGKLYAILSM